MEIDYQLPQFCQTVLRGFLETSTMDRKSGDKPKKQKEHNIPKTVITRQKNANNQKTRKIQFRMH